MFIHFLYLFLCKYSRQTVFCEHVSRCYRTAGNMLACVHARIHNGHRESLLLPGPGSTLAYIMALKSVRVLEKHMHR